jgi:hypothetical protein
MAQLLSTTLAVSLSPQKAQHEMLLILSASFGFDVPQIGAIAAQRSG